MTTPPNNDEARRAFELLRRAIGKLTVAIVDRRHLPVEYAKDQDG